jgi:aminopeptidase-like protein
VVLSRSQFAEYKEYHTSLDDLNLVTPQNLIDSLEKMYLLVLSIEDNCVPTSTVIFGEPFYQKYNLITSIGGNRIRDPNLVTRKWLMNRSNGKRDLLNISMLSGIPVTELAVEARRLSEKGLLQIRDAPIW